MSPVAVTQGNTNINVEPDAEPEQVVVSAPTVEVYALSPVQTNVETHSGQRVDVRELGIVGQPGAPGPKGDKGDPGASALNPLVYVQSVAATDWLIPHTLHTRPQVTIVDSANQMVFGTVSYPDLDNVLVQFENPFSGTAYLL